MWFYWTISSWSYPSPFLPPSDKIHQSTIHLDHNIHYNRSGNVRRRKYKSNNSIWSICNILHPSNGPVRTLKYISKIQSRSISERPSRQFGLGTLCVLCCFCSCYGGILSNLLLLLDISQCFLSLHLLRWPILDFGDDWRRRCIGFIIGIESCILGDGRGIGMSSSLTRSRRVKSNRSCSSPKPMRYFPCHAWDWYKISILNKAIGCTSISLLNVYWTKV